MSNSPEAGWETHPSRGAGAAVEIDAWCARFEQLFRQDGEVDLRQYVGQFPRERQDELFVECLLIKIWIDRERGRHCSLEETLRDFPERASIVRRCFPVVNPVASSTAVALSDTPENDRTEADPSGTTCGVYTVDCRIGRGRFGDVYRAFDRKLQRYVALKICRCHDGDGNMAPNVLREARLMASIELPGIVPVYDTGVTDDGRPFIVTRLVTEGNLEQWASTHRPTPGQSASIISEVAAALQGAHELGVVHRDVKSTNIFMDAAGRPMLGDFGLAIREDERRRRRGELAGSPCYMAPEQIIDGMQVDGRTDLWGLGVCLYQLLTGTVPFPDDGTSVIFEEILHRAPRPPRQLNSRIPAPLEAIVLKCLQKQVQDRYNSAADLAKSLRHWSRLNGPESATEVAEKMANSPGQGQRLWLFLGGGVMLSAAALIAASRSWLTDMSDAETNAARSTETTSEQSTTNHPDVVSVHDAVQRDDAERGDATDPRPVQAAQYPVSDVSSRIEQPSQGIEAPAAQAALPENERLLEKLNPTVSPEKSDSKVMASIEIDGAWRVGDTPTGFMEIALDNRSQTIGAPLLLDGDFTLSLCLNVENQQPRHGEGIAVELIPRSGGGALSFKLEIAQAFSSGRSLVVQWPGRGSERIDVSRGLRTVQLTRTGRIITLEIDGQTIKRSPIVPTTRWLNSAVGELRLTLTGTETRLSRLRAEQRPVKQ